MSPLTKYLCDLIGIQRGSLTARQVRQRWKAGAYIGVRSDWATAYAKQFGIERSEGNDDG